MSFVETAIQERLTYKEAARLLECTERTIYRYKKQGLLKSIKTGGRVHFRLTDIMHFKQGKAC